MPLTAHQQETEDKILSLLETKSTVLVKGSAGVGKTFMMNSLIKKLLFKTNKKIQCVAPTNKAVGVLRSKVDDHPSIEFLTLHSALKMKRFINNSNGEAYFKPSFSDRNKPFKGVSYIIVDEGSMVGEEINDFLEYHARLMNVKIIFVGDHKQLNPVKEEVSPIFTKGHPEVELTEIIRQGEGNPIIDLSRNIKEIYKYEDNLIDWKGYMHSKDRTKVIETLATVNGTDELKYLGYTNKDVDSINTQVRQRIYGANPRKVEVGESIIFNSPYKDIYHTNQELKIESVDLDDQFFYVPYKDSPEKIKLRTYIINGKQIEGGWMGVFVVHEKHEKYLRTIAAITKKACLSKNMNWGDRDKFLSQFGDIKYNHALTVHKSQGSTYETVILNVSNLSINSNEAEKQRLFYTGITRASKMLVLFNN